MAFNAALIIATKDEQIKKLNERIEQLEKALEQIKEHEMKHYKYKTDIYLMADEALGKEE